MSQLIAHYVHKDKKFTSGYIFFMCNVMRNYKHIFFIDERTKIKSNVEGAEILPISKPREILTNKEVRKVLDTCNKFIVSGVFLESIYVVFLSRRIFRKTYLHFWGNDFYHMREKIDRKFLKQKGIKSYMFRKLYYSMKKILIRRSEAIILLLDEEYDEFVEITGIKKKYFVARMPGDGSVKKAELNTNKKVPPHLILLGNSATETNQHIEALNILKKYSNEDIKIICPLSYGDKDYAKKVADYGHKLFGSKFVPLIDFLPKDEYFEMLERVEVAIFNNDRQQAMGNISRLLAVGCKVYLRNDTSMWRAYLRMGYSVYHIKDIESKSFDEFILFTNKEASKNHKAYLKNIDISIRYNAWKSVLDDKINFIEK